MTVYHQPNGNGLPMPKAESLKRNLLPYIPKLTPHDRQTIAFLFWLNQIIGPLEPWELMLPFWEHDTVLRYVNRELQIEGKSYPNNSWFNSIKRIKAILEQDPETINN